ncbi:MAG: PAS domain S-box protein [Desulfovibrionaceae bacterium]|jgi:PAS domain S-box-containing protein|nr:PAS domain S-box protein [Desulfovibrionaceae bacterium]
MTDRTKTKRQLLEELERLRGRVRELEQASPGPALPGLSSSNPFVRSLKKFQVVFDNAPIGIYQAAVDGRYISVNTTLAALYGFDSPEQMRGAATDLTAQLYADPAQRDALALLLAERGEIHNHEILARRTDGTTFSTSRNIRTVYDESGTPLYYEGFVVDIDQRRKAEEKYRAIFENSVAGIFRTSLDGRFLDANPATALILGYDSPADLMATVKDIGTDVFADSGVDPKTVDYQEMEKGVISYETRLRKKNGDEITVHLNVRIIRGPDGEPCLEGFLQDITERARAVQALRSAHREMGKRVEERTRDLRKSLVRLRREVKERTLTEEKLRESEEMFRRITDSAQDGILMMDDEGCISFWNKAAEAIFGYSAAEARGRNLHGLLAPESLGDDYLEGFDRFRATGHGPIIGRTMEMEAVRKDGENFPIEISISSLRFKGRWNAIAVLRDITQRKEVEESLREAKETAEAASRLKSDFLSIVSHELRTPLTSVLGFAKIIRKKLERSIEPNLQGADQRTERTWRQIMENMAVIVAEGERLTALINDVLDLAKLEARKVDWRMDAYAVRDLIDHTLTATASLFRGTPVQPKVDVQRGLPEVLCDRDRIIQVLINLISNAVKFTARGAITCRARLTGESVTISVEDTGIGIPDAELPTIFDKFKQAGDTLTGKPRGTGLGLTICNQIVDQHGGTLWVKSAQGEGSVFSFTLPLADRIGSLRDIR